MKSNDNGAPIAFDFGKSMASSKHLLATIGPLLSTLTSAPSLHPAASAIVSASLRALITASLSAFSLTESSSLLRKEKVILGCTSHAMMFITDSESLSLSVGNSKLTSWL